MNNDLANKSRSTQNQMSTALPLDSSSNTPHRKFQCLNKSNSALSITPFNEIIKENSFLSGNNPSHQSIIVHKLSSKKKKHSTFREHFIHNIKQIKQSTTKLINKLKDIQSQHLFNASSSPCKSLKLDLQFSLSMTTKNNNDQAKMFAFWDLKGNTKFKRKRLLKLTEEQVFQRSKKVYSLPFALLNARTNINDTHLQLSAITDQLKLISSNVDQLKTSIVFSSNFMKAFADLADEQKTKFNSLIEETTGLLILIQPKILRKMHASLDQILYCVIPNVSNEESVVVQSEDDCLVLNLKWFNSVTTYFIACFEVFQVMKTNITQMLFLPKEYFAVKVCLDLLRYDTNCLIVTGRHYIEKYYNDEEMINRFEEGVKHIDQNQCHSNYCAKESSQNSQMKMLKNVNLKLSKINAALDIDSNAGPQQSRFKRYKNKHKHKFLSVDQKGSLLNLPVINDLMQYYDKRTREQIISHRVFERILSFNDD